MTSKKASGMQISDVMTRSVITAPPNMSLALAHTYQLGTLAIATCMTRGVVTVPPEADVVQGMRQLLAGPYGCLPVLAGQQLVGIVTAMDGLRGFLMDLGSAAARRPVRAYRALI
jgi:CBS domain-containing protein